MRRAKTKLDQKLADLQEAEARRKAELDRLEAERNDLLSRLHALDDEEAAVLAGEAEAEDVTRRRAESETRLAEVTVAIERLQAAAPGLERRISKAQSAIAEARIATAKNVWLEDLADQHAAAARFGKRIAAAAAAGAELDEARRKAAESLKNWEAALEAAGEEMPSLPKIADEPEWDSGIDGLHALLEAGPLRPVARHNARLAESHAQSERQYGEIVAWTERHGRRPDLAKLRPADRERVERLWAEQKRAADERREAAGRARAFPSLR